MTPNFFAVLGAAPSLGRVFGEDENVQVLSHPVVVLSDRLWRTRFGAAKEVVGQQVVLNGRTFTVLGVMPRGFRESWWEWTGLSGSDAWIPAMMAPIGMSPNAKAWRDTPLAIEATHANLWLGVGRLRADHSLREARAEAAVLGREVTHLWPPPPGVVAPWPWERRLGRWPAPWPRRPFGWRSSGWWSGPRSARGAPPTFGATSTGSAPGSCKRWPRASSWRSPSRPWPRSGPRTARAARIRWLRFAANESDEGRWRRAGLVCRVAAARGRGQWAGAPRRCPPFRPRSTS